MPIPVLKVFSLGVRVFSKPLFSHLKKVQKKNIHGEHALSFFFVRLGNYVSFTQIVPFLTSWAAKLLKIAYHFLNFYPILTDSNPEEAILA